MHGIPLAEGHRTQQWEMREIKKTFRGWGVTVMLALTVGMSRAARTGSRQRCSRSRLLEQRAAGFLYIGEVQLRPVWFVDTDLDPVGRPIRSGSTCPPC